MALLVAVPALAVIAQPASAHEQTEERCDYDPLTQQEYNCRQVEVSHVHQPNHYSPPPDTSPRSTTTTAPTTTEPPSCPAGQHSNGGAGRNCHAHSFTPPCGTGTWSPGHGHPPIQRPPCPAPEPPSCPAGQHSNGGAGRNCHAHSFTPPCGTGTWSPGHGHTPIQRPPCTTTTTPDEDSDDEDDDSSDEGNDDDQSDGNAGDCPSGTFVSGNCEPRGGTPTTTADPCAAWMSATRDALHNSEDPVPPPDGCGTDVGGALGRYFTRMGERRIESAEAREQAYAELRRAIQDAWNYEIPHVDDAINTVNCAWLGVVLVRSKGKAAAAPGWGSVVSGLGCGRYLEQLTIDGSGPDADDGENDENGQDSDGRGSSEESGSDDEEVRRPQPRPFPQRPGGGQQPSWNPWDWGATKG
ncbi:hypothetical protein [Candidatus Poriferisodalis sp.]|uniref:hypothetical protein n=1 Tax=Candidatus Poriferisodalis sp. TaxID=3101277 RepID=UPI003B027F47